MNQYTNENFIRSFKDTLVEKRSTYKDISQEMLWLYWQILSTISIGITALVWIIMSVLHRLRYLNPWSPDVGGDCSFVSLTADRGESTLPSCWHCLGGFRFGLTRELCHWAWGKALGFQKTFSVYSFYSLIAVKI